MFTQSEIDAAAQPMRQRLEVAGRTLKRSADEAGTRASEFARVASRRGRDTALATVAQVRRRPAPVGLGLLVGAAAVALWLSPKLRRDLSEGAGRLWNEVQKHRGALRF